tara:strand:+ start:1031 stop:1384 length:354 start_codon:yes stop_codon:yes gene_type:complete
MKISTEKRDFLKRISNGLAVLMDCSMLSDEIYVTQEDEIEVFIKNNLLDGSSFSEEKFDALMDTIDDTTLEELLEFFDDRDMGLHNAYHESCIPCDDLFSAGVELGELYSFSDLLLF